MAPRIIVLALGSILTLSGMSTAMAQNVPGHPGINQIDQRLLNQQRFIDAGVNQRQIGARGAAQDSGLDARVGRQLSRDEARHNGRITGAERRQLNRELDQNSRRIYAQRHR